MNGVDLPTTDGGLTFAGWTEVTSDTLSISAEDAAGNAISEQYSYTTTNDGETLAVEYDDNGNTTRVVTVAADGLSTTTRTFEWDGNDRMRTITYDDGSRTEFEYDYMGRRVQIREYGANQVLDSRQELIWDGLRIAKITDFDNPVTTYDFHFPQGQARTITFPGGSSGSDYLYTRDHLGSVREVVDAADGSLEARYDYTPWGERTQTAGAVKVDFAFTGHHYHEKSGLHLAPYRECSAEMGRWMSRDPIEENSNLNVFVYAKNSSISFYDPDGKRSFPARIVDVLKHKRGKQKDRACGKDPNAPGGEGHRTWTYAPMSSSEYLLEAFWGFSGRISGICFFVLCPSKAHAPPPPLIKPNCNDYCRAECSGFVGLAKFDCVRWCRQDCALHGT